MFEKPSLLVRIGVGKTVGFLVGLIGLFTVPYVWPDANALLPWGFLFWYTTMGAMIGMFGIFSSHPILKFPMPWWARSSGLGAWMNLTLTFFIYDELAAMFVAVMGADSAFTSPFWFVAEGAIIGLLIGFFATQFGGEGPESVAQDF